MNRQMKLFFLICCTVFLLTGCFQWDTKLAIHSDGSIDYGFKIEIQKSLYGQFKEGFQQGLGGNSKDLKKEGITIEEFEKEDKKGMIISKNYQDLNSLKKDDNSFGSGGSPDSLSPGALGENVKIEDELFTSSYSINHTIDLASLTNQLDMEKLESLPFGKLIEFRFVLTLPAEADKHNADKVTDDGNTLIWNLTPGEKTKIQAEASAFNWVFWLLIIGGALLIFAPVGFFVWKQQQNKNDAANIIE